jgi:DNA-binding NarL/FixJ family response regulator
MLAGSREQPQPVRRVLLIEDDGLFGLMLHHRLAEHCAPSLATTLHQARVLLTQHSFSGFLVDVQLPDGRGTELLPAIRAVNAHVPIVVMTGMDTQESSRDALAYRAYFVAKPFPFGWLDSFRDWLERPTGSQSLALSLKLMGLTPRECDVFVALAGGATAEEVGCRLDINTNTVQSHCRNVYEKLDLRSLNEVLARACGWG